MKENQRAKHQKNRNRKIRKLVKLQINHGTEKTLNGMIETERTKEYKKKNKERKKTNLQRKKTNLQRKK